MKQARMAALTATVIITALVMLALAGCGGGGKLDPGAKSFTLNSTWHGSLAGMSIAPHDAETVYTDTWVHVSWPDANFPPPAQFTIRVEKEEHPNDWGGIHTRLRADYSNPIGGSWWFEPVNPFSPYTNYRIIVIDTADPNNQAIVVFTSSGGPEPLSRDGAPRVMAASPLSTGASGAASTNAVKYRPAGAENAPPLAGEDSVDHVINTGK